MLSKIQEAFHETLGVPLEIVTEKTTIDNLPEWDSMKHMELIMSLESKFHVSFEVHEILLLNSVSKIIGVINNKKA
jgi:acyl carrier protein